MKTLCRSLAILCFYLALASQTQATVIQILHTNDNHSYLKNSTHDEARGGMARLKGMMNKLKAEMDEKNIKTYVVDAGDFLEGNIYYMAKEGRTSFEIHNEMGYDVGVLGNHDYQMGTKELDKLLGEVPPKFNLLAANFSVNPNFKNIKSHLFPYKEYKIDDLKIAFLGVTTDEFLYAWRVTNGKIEDPIKTAQKYEEILKNRGNDYVIAVTHIGVKKDKKLAKKTSSLDLIIGGHSHTALNQAVFEKNRVDRYVPIVQAGHHTEYVGRLIVELKKGRPLKILKYELVPVILEQDKIDIEIAGKVSYADDEINAYYGKDWLDEVIGHSDLKPNDLKGDLKWSFFISDALKEKAKTDIAIHSQHMNGSNFPVGDITRRKIIDSMPRIFEVDQKYGWDIYTANLRGIWVRLFISTIAKYSDAISVSGMSIEYEKSFLGFRIKKAYINGEKISPFKTYRVAFSEGIVRGALGINDKSKIILKQRKNTGSKIWATLEEKLAKRHSIDQISVKNKTMIVENMDLD